MWARYKLPNFHVSIIIFYSQLKFSQSKNNIRDLDHTLGYLVLFFFFFFLINFYTDLERPIIILGSACGARTYE